MNYTNLYFGTIVWRWIFRQIGWAILLIAGIISLAAQGDWSDLGLIALIVTPPALLAYGVARLLRWFINRGYPEEQTLEDMCRPGQEALERELDPVRWAAEHGGAPAAGATVIGRVEPTLDRRVAPASPAAVRPVAPVVVAPVKPIGIMEQCIMRAAARRGA